jgi:hypothetical protein
VDDHASPRVRTGKDKIAFLAPRPSGEPSLVLVAKITQLDDEQNYSGLLFNALGVVGLNNASLKLFLHVR